MSNPWFRMYTEFAYDPKVQIVTEALQRRYVMALCLHCDGKFENRPDDEIALALRVTVEEWKLTRDEFVARGLLTVDGKISGWEKRQYISDVKDPTAPARQKRYREKKREQRNAAVTSRPPDSDTDTESDTENKKGRGSRFALAQPPEEWISFCKTERPDLDPLKTFVSFTDYWKAKPGKDGVKLDWLATWRNWCRTQKAPPLTTVARTGFAKQDYSAGLEGFHVVG